MLTGAAPHHAAAHGQRTERGVNTAHVLAEVAADGDGWSGGIAPEPGAAGPGLQGELGGRPVGERTAPTEVGDGDDDRAWGLPQQLRVDAQRGGAGPSRGHDDDVGAGEFGAVLIRIRRHAQAALAGVEVAVERTGHTVRYRRAGGRVLPQRISLRRFDFADLRTRIHQQLPAIAAGQAVTDLDDSQSVERRRPVIGLVTHAAIYTITAKIAKPMEFAGQRPCALSCCRLRGLG